MSEFSPQWIASTLQTDWQRPPSSPIRRFAFDSRKIEPGDCFVALCAERHGHEFLGDALLKGASAAIVEKYHPEIALPQIVVPNSLVGLQNLAKAHRQLLEGTVIALTGSSGKTSTKELIAAILPEGTHKTFANFNNHIGLPITILSCPIDAPYLVVEAGINKPDEMDALAAIALPDIAVLTNIGTAHQEFFHTLEGTAYEKGKLLRAVRPGGNSLLHIADASLGPLQDLPEQVHILSTPKDFERFEFPSNYQNTFCKIELIENPTLAQAWEIEIGDFSYPMGLVTPGMARNTALALAVGRLCKIEADTLAARLAAMPLETLRGSWKPLSQRASLYIDAYNANPDSLRDALWRFHKLSNPNNPRHYVIGSMGELGAHAEELHRDTLAQLSLRPNDYATLLGQHAQSMREGLIEAGANPNNIELCNDLEAIKSKILKIDADTFVKGSHSTRLYTLDSLC